MKRVLITGSTQGIGKAIAEELVKRGYEVIIHCISDMDYTNKIKEEIGAASAVVGDLSKENEVEEIYKKTGDVDCLILNASVQYKAFWLDATKEDIDEQLNVNIKSTIRLMQLYYPYMKENRWGRIITLGSVNQHKRHKELPVYAATKCAVMSLVENVAKYAGEYGITVNNISPGAILTPRTQKVYDDPEARARAEHNIPVGRYGKPNDIVGLVALLLSDDAAYITGDDILVDGGLKL